MTPDVPVETVTVPPGGPPVQTPFPPTEYTGRSVVNLSLGGSHALSEALTVHGGAYSSPSPVGAGSSFFRQLDLYGARAGLSFRERSLSGSMGLGYETGRSGASPGLDASEPRPIDDSIRVQRFSVVLAAEYRT